MTAIRRWTAPTDACHVSPEHRLPLFGRSRRRGRQSDHVVSSFEGRCASLDVYAFGVAFLTLQPTTRRRGPGTAILFALTIVEKLFGKEKRDEVAGPMVVSDKL